MKRPTWSTLLLTCLLLAGCASRSGEAVSNFSPEQLRMLASNSLCNRYAQGPNVTAERQRRGLGDCSPADQSCANAGYRAGSPNYARCRADVAHQAALRQGDGRCYFDTPASGRLAGTLAHADLICSGDPSFAAPLPVYVSPPP